jgi:3-carboxy-cis,cis-muconate cycloisomerase
LQLQLGGAVGTLAVLGEKGPAVAAHGRGLGLRADAAWHTQRDEWIRLGSEMAVLAGSLGKIATDLSLMAQGEIAELAEPSGNGRGGSSAMPHKRNPVSSMIALAAATVRRTRPLRCWERWRSSTNAGWATGSRTGRMAGLVPGRAWCLACAQ